MPEKGKILKVTIEFEHEILQLEGTEAEKWSKHNESVASLATVHGMNPFDFDRINWTVIPK
jgi:hypothetical protein